MNYVRQLKDKEGNLYYNTEIPYSTEEVRIGTWIDGKPLYRRTIIFNKMTLTPVSIQEYDIEYDNDSFWNTVGLIMIDYTHTYLIRYNGLINNGISSINNPDWWFTIHTSNPSKKNFQIIIGDKLLTDFRIVMTIEYTKTID